MQESQNCLTPSLQPCGLWMWEQRSEEDCVLTCTFPGMGEQGEVRKEESSESVRSYELCGR